MMTHNVIITGASGCLGKHLVNYFLSRQEYCVYAVVRSPEKHFMHHERLHYLYQDLRVPCFLHEVCIDTPLIIHCAALLPKGSQPQDMVKVNVGGTQHVLEWAVNNQAKQFINISSGGVYGYRNDHHFLETDPVSPIGLYGETKWMAEQLVNMYQHHFGLNTLNIRLFFPYGVAYNNGVIHHLVNSIKNGEPISIHCDGKPQINPIHIDDVVQAIAKMISMPEIVGTYNLAGKECLSIAELTQQLSHVIGNNAKIISTNLQQGDLMGSIALLTKHYDWQPHVTLSQGLAYCGSNKKDEHLQYQQ
jgi:nucleoside-diphosphate-sugar epimerase